jgi:hypothetical protein
VVLKNTLPDWGTTYSCGNSIGFKRKKGQFKNWFFGLSPISLLRAFFNTENCSPKFNAKIGFIY